MKVYPVMEDCIFSGIIVFQLIQFCSAKSKIYFYFCKYIDIHCFTKQVYSNGFWIYWKNLVKVSKTFQENSHTGKIVALLITNGEFNHIFIWVIFPRKISFYSKNE